MSKTMPPPPVPPPPVQHERVVALKSLFDAPQRSGFPYDKSRRATLPSGKLFAVKNPPAYPSPRIEKQYANHSRKRRSRGVDNDLSQKFEDGLEDTRVELSGEADRLLTETETEFNERIIQIESEFGTKLKLATDHERQAFRPLADEQLCVTNEQGENEETWLLGARINDFENIMVEEERILDKLWTEWTKVQAEIVCLAVEVLGVDVVTTHEGYEEYPGLRKNVPAAGKVYQDACLKYKEVAEEAKKLTEWADKVKDATLKTLDTQEKAWKEKQKKTQKAINSALRGLVSQD